MALLPPIHDRPADRPETWAEYLSRRAMVALHRQLLDEVAACGVTWRADSVRRFLADPGKTDLFFTDAGVLQVENLNIDLAPELKELIEPPKRTGGLPIPIAYGAGRMPTNLL